MGSVGQRASKLLAVKVGGLKKKSAIWPRPLLNQSARVRLRPGSNLSQSLTDSNFAALWPTDPIFTASKDLNPSKKCAKHFDKDSGKLQFLVWKLKILEIKCKLILLYNCNTKCLHLSVRFLLKKCKNLVFLI